MSRAAPPGGAARGRLRLLLAVLVVAAAQPAAPAPLAVRRRSTAEGATERLEASAAASSHHGRALAEPQPTVTWLPVLPSPSGGDCWATCAAAGLHAHNTTNYGAADGSFSQTTLCAMPWPNATVPFEYHHGALQAGRLAGRQRGQPASRGCSAGVAQPAPCA